jgi:hypothetical protein
MTPQDMEVGRWRVLSCYTANLAAYLARFSPDDEVADRIAWSVRLSVRTDLPDGIGFSHHAEPLNRLPGGHVLVYRGADDPRQALQAEVARHGCALALTHSAQMPWSLADDEGNPPHLLLVDDVDHNRWHVIDHFAGLLPTGEEQQPYADWIDGDTLLGFMHGHRPFSEEQERRNHLVFGFPAPLPDARCRWLERVPGPDGSLVPPLPGRWLYEPNAVWRFLDERLREQTTRKSEPKFLDDLWAASQHHRHRCARLLLSPLCDDLGLRSAVEELESQWAQLPRTLRFAAESARRGRPRAALISAIAGQLTEGERNLRAALAGHDWVSHQHVMSTGPHHD